MVTLLWLLALLCLAGSAVAAAIGVAGSVLGLGLASPLILGGFAAFAIVGAMAEILRTLHQIRDQAIIPETEKAQLYAERMQRQRRLLWAVPITIAIVAALAWLISR